MLQNPLDIEHYCVVRVHGTFITKSYREVISLRIHNNEIQ